ncbi:hypothetical protein GYA49_06270 [Candidatus Beckwithbacteria bacterium]|nr:hypothetical protein [Candidatus Beckwithbacteria bacterium]
MPSKTSQSPAPSDQAKKANKQVVKASVKPEKTGSSFNLPWLLVGLALVSIASLSLSFWLLGKLPAKAEAIKQLRTQVLAYQISDQDEALLLQALKDTESDREVIIAAFPTEESLLNFIAVIDSLKNAQVEVLRFSVDSDTPSKIGRNPSFLPITLSLRGEAKAVEQALTKITDSPYFIRPVIYYYESGDGKGEQVIINTQFHLFVSDEFTKTKS